MPRIAMLLSNPFRPDPRVLKEALSLNGKGYTVLVLCWDRTKELLAEEQIQPGLWVSRIQIVPSNYGIGIRQIARLPYFWRAALPRLDQFKPDVIHCHDFDTLPAGLWYGKQHNIPVIYDAHEYYADMVKPRLGWLAGSMVYPVIQSLERVCSRQASGIITVDEPLASRYRPSGKPVEIIGHYPPRQWIETPAQVFQKPEINLLYAGRLSFDRGLGTYLEILRSLCRMGMPACLHLAGVFTPGSEKDRFIQASLGIEDKIFNHGWVPFPALPELFRMADVGLSILQPEPRYVAALPVKMFEYMAAGLPVLASDFPAVADIMVKWNFGELVSPAAPNTAAAIIKNWQENPALPQRLGSNGRAAVLAEYNWENLAEKLDRFYQLFI